MSSVELKTGERIDSLIRQELKIIQDPASFCFSMDAVLLAEFAGLKKGDRAVDLGTGTGVIPLLLTTRQDDIQVIGLEVQQQSVERAVRSVRLNNLEDKISIMQGDLRQATNLLPAGTFNLVTSNPPYMGRGAGLINVLDSMTIARHEVMCNLEDVIIAAAGLLTFKGRLAMVHKPHRLVDIFCLMRKHGLEPKRLRFVHPRPGRKPNMVLVEGLAGGGVELEVVPPLYVYGEDGEYTEELKNIYYVNCQS